MKLPSPWIATETPVSPGKVMGLEGLLEIEATSTDQKEHWEKGDLGFTPKSREAVLSSGRWNRLENIKTGQSVLIRIVRNEEGVKITSVLWLPPKDGYNPEGMSKFPLEQIEQAYTEHMAELDELIRSFAKDSAVTGNDSLGRPGRGLNVKKDFYPRFAARFKKLEASGLNPIHEIAKSENVTTKIVQNWATVARKQGLLEAVKPGRKTRI
jgi:hypothetical protein